MEPAGFRFCWNLWDGQVNPSRRSAPSLDAPQVGYLAAVGFSRSAQAASVSEAQHLELEIGGASIRGRSDPVAQRLNERGEDRFLLTSGAGHHNQLYSHCAPLYSHSDQAISADMLLFRGRAGHLSGGLHDLPTLPGGCP